MDMGNVFNFKNTNYKKMIISKAPIEFIPLGLKPFWLHNQIRYNDILEAITRYERANILIPQEWIDEMQSLEAYFKNAEKKYQNELFFEMAHRSLENQVKNSIEELLNRQVDEFFNVDLTKTPTHFQGLLKIQKNG